MERMISGATRRTKSGRASGDGGTDSRSEGFDAPRESRGVGVARGVDDPRHPDARELVAIRDAHHGGTPLDWCCHGSLHGNTSHDHASVAKLLLDAGSPESDTREASPAVKAILAK